MYWIQRWILIISVNHNYECKDIEKEDRETRNVLKITFRNNNIKSIFQIGIKICEIQFKLIVLRVIINNTS